MNWGCPRQSWLLVRRAKERCEERLFSLSAWSVLSSCLVNHHHHDLALLKQGPWSGFWSIGHLWPPSKHNSLVSTAQEFYWTTFDVHRCKMDQSSFTRLWNCQNDRGTERANKCWQTGGHFWEKHLSMNTQWRERVVKSCDNKVSQSILHNRSFDGRGLWQWGNRPKGSMPAEYCHGARSWATIQFQA